MHMCVRVWYTCTNQSSNTARPQHLIAICSYIRLPNPTLVVLVCDKVLAEPYLVLATLIRLVCPIAALAVGVATRAVVNVN